jgi:hypothetical protein
VRGVINGPCTWPGKCPTPDDCGKGCLMPAPDAPQAGIVHIAGTRVQIDDKLRQRCAWCGAVLIDYDLASLAVPLGQDPTPATWPEGELVLVDGALSVHVEHVDGDDLPEASCARLEAKAAP